MFTKLDLTISNSLSEKVAELNKYIFSNTKTIVSSETNSGKSHYIFYYLIPEVLNKRKGGEKHIVCCATPLKFLTIQQKNHLENSIYNYKIVCQDYHSAKKIDETWLSNVDIIQTTFESLKEVYKRVVECGYTMTLIIDEMHQIITSASYMKLGLINNIIDNCTRVIGFSGTIKELYYDFFQEEYAFVDVKSEKYKLENIYCNVIDKGSNVVKQLCSSLINRDTNNKHIVFLNDIRKIEQCYQFCLDNNIKATRVHRSLSKIDLTQNNTLKNIFEHETIDDDVDVLFTTSIMDTGINIKNNNVEIWYVSTLYDNDIIKFEQSIARYRNAKKTIRLFLLEQKKESMYNLLLQLSVNYKTSKSLLKYYKSDLKYIENCVLQKDFSFKDLKPFYYKQTTKETHKNISEFNEEIDKINKIIEYKKTIGLSDSIKIEFIKAPENSELNPVLDYVYKDSVGFYKLNKFKLFDFIRKKEIETITNKKFLELISKPYRKIHLNGVEIENNPKVDESIDNYEKKREDYIHLVYDILTLKSSEDSLECQKNFKGFIFNMNDLAEDDWKEEIYNFSTNLEEKYGITIPLDKGECIKMLENNKYRPLFTLFYKESSFILKSVIKVYNLIKRFNSVDYLNYIDLDEILLKINDNFSNTAFNKFLKEVTLLLNQEIWVRYKEMEVRTNEIVEFQTIFYNLFTRKFSNFLNKEISLEKIIANIRTMPNIQSINIKNYKNEHYVRLIKHFFEITTRRKKEGKSFKTHVKFIKQKNLVNYFSEQVVLNIKNLLDKYFKNFVLVDDEIFC